MDKNISTLLREIKEKSKWSEPKIASQIGTSQPTVNRILKGQTDCKGSTLRSIIALHKSMCGGRRAASTDAKSFNDASSTGEAK